jgi:hypothetical protein
VEERNHEGNRRFLFLGFIIGACLRASPPTGHIGGPIPVATTSNIECKLFPVLTHLLKSWTVYSERPTKCWQTKKLFSFIEPFNYILCIYFKNYLKILLHPN